MCCFRVVLSHRSAVYGRGPKPPSVGRHRLESDAFGFAERLELGVDSVLLDDGSVFEVDTVEEASALLHIRDANAGRVEPLTDLHRAVLAEAEVGLRRGGLTVRTCEEDFDFLGDVRHTLAVDLLALVHTSGEDFAPCDFRRSQDARIHGLVGVAVDTKGRLSGERCVAAVGPQLGEETGHNKCV